ncbi:tetratricopeptide repeat protein [Micromonospora sp. NPDC003197]
MTGPEPHLDPTATSSAGQYVALLRQVRDRSGLTFRAIARRAEANGDVLPASTLATMFGRVTLPRRELVVALLRACEVPDDQIARWLTSWHRLAAARGQRPAVLHLVPSPTERHEPAWSAAAPETPRPAPVVAGAPVPFQLPPPPAMLVGREAETARLYEVTTNAGAVCLVQGAGGIGKSALTLHFAHRVADRYPGGCLYADLHGASAGIAPIESIEVLARFLRALGTPSIPLSVEEASTLFRTMTASTGGVLVVLDNAASAEQVRPLLPSGPDCTSIVTSRWSLADLDTTVRIPLEPLSDQAALSLLGGLGVAERIAAEPAAAAMIVRRCEGLPLAIRIVGARAAARPDATLRGLAERISDERRRLDLLEVGNLSVRASLHLGYQAFSESPHEEQRAAIRLFRLAGLPDWTDAAPPACAALADVPVPVAERLLEQLVDAHLLEPVGDTRYRFHDMVRLFARECAYSVEPPTDRDAALHRLTAHLFATTAAATQLLYPHDHFRIHDLAHPADHHHHLSTTAQAWSWFEHEHTNLLGIARQRLLAGQDLAEVRDLGQVIVKFLDYAGYVTEQLQFGELGVEAAQRLGDQSATALALNGMAVGMLREGRLSKGVSLLERSLAIHRDLGDRAGEAACLNNLGNALRDSGDLDGALTHLQASLALRRELGDRYKEGSVLDNLGLVLQRRGEYAQAVAHHQASLAITRQCGDRLREALSLVNFAETLHVSGDNAEAIRQAHQALAICQEFDHRRGIGLAEQVLGDAHAALGRMAEARRHWTEALGLLDGLDRQAQAKLRAALDGDQDTGAAH